MNGINKIRYITCGHKTFGFAELALLSLVGVKWLFEHITTHQLMLIIDTSSASSFKHFMPPNVGIN